jgi:hypothetical protein
MTLSPLLVSLLTPVKKRVMSKDLDWWCLVDGREGVAKSTLAFQIASWLDSTFNLERVCFSLDELEQQIIKAPKFTAIVLDEGFAVANARAAMTELNRRAILLAAEARQKNLFILICAPSIFDMDKYFAIHRTNCLFHVYFDKTYNRGQATFFPYGKKKSLYIYGKKMYSYARPKAHGEPIGFSKGYGNIDDTQYRAKKIKAFEDRNTFLTQKQIAYAQRDALIMHLWNSFPKRHRLEMLNNIFYKVELAPITEDIIKNIQKRINKQNGKPTIDAGNNDTGSSSAGIPGSESDNGIQPQDSANNKSVPAMPENK